MAGIGGDLQQLTDLQKTFKDQSGNVSDLSRVISARLDSTNWTGPASERFRSAWAGEFKPALAKLQAALDEAGVEVAKRRDGLANSQA